MTDPKLAWRKERFRQIYDEVYDDLWAYAHRRAPAEQAADVVSETLSIAWQRLDDLPPPPRTRPWLFGVSRNLLRAEARKRRRSAGLQSRLTNELVASVGGAAVSGATADGSEAIVDSDHTTSELRCALQALEGLKEIDQEIIRLVAWEELSHGEIAEMLDMKEKAVTVRLHRARTKLEKNMAKQRNAAGPETTSAIVATKKVREEVKPRTGPRQAGIDGNVTTEKLGVER